MKKICRQLMTESRDLRSNSPKTLAIGVAFAMGLAGGCGKEEKSSGSIWAIGQGLLFKGTGSEQIDLNLNGIEVGQKFAVMPFALGKYETVDGAGSEQFLVSAEVKGEAAAAKEKTLGFGPDTGALTWHQRDHALRSLWNHFVPDRHGQLPNWWWQAVRDLDRRDLKGERKPLALSDQSLEASFKRSIKTTAALLKSEQSVKKSAALAASGCPSSIFVPSSSAIDDTSDYDEIPLSSSTIKDKVDGGSYCIVYLSNLSGEKGETSKDNVKASVEAVLNLYKNSIYLDDFPDVSYNGGTFTFKPVFIIADFSNEGIWPSDSKLQFTGAFIRAITVAQSRPVLYIASDPTKLKTPAPDAKAKGVFHSTIAHEFQHAIMHYFREARNAQSGELASLDEGLAHIMEDLLGYGDENFESYAKPYLISLPDGNEPFLRGAVHNGELLNNKQARGATQTLLYYLMSQKGGVTYESGSLKGGEGLALIRNFVKNKGLGVPHLKTTYGGEWLEAIYGYLGALAVDNTGAKEANKIFEVMAPISGVTDTSGVKGKTVGMRFNGFKDLPDRTGEYLSITAEEVKDPGIELFHYHTRPLLYTVQNVTSPLEVSIAVTTNSGVAVVRIK